MTVNQISVFTPFTKGTQNQSILQLGKFLTPGDAQQQLFGLGITTLNATPASMLTDVSNANSKIVLKNNQTMGFEAFIVARALTGESAFYRLLGAIDRGANAASTALVSAATKTVFNEDDASWDVAAAADTTLGALDIQVTGAAGLSINWVSQVRTFEVITV